MADSGDMLPGMPTRLFVATHGGQIRLIKNGSLVSTPFASLNSALSLVGGSGSDERGLIGLQERHYRFDKPILCLVFAITLLKD